MIYYVEPNNWTKNIPEQIISDNGIYDYSITTTTTNSPDPAEGCDKEFEATYKCGINSNNTKTVKVPKNALNKLAQFNCSTEYNLCNNVRLRLEDDGHLTVYKIDSSTGNEEELWNNDLEIVPDSLENNDYKTTAGKEWINENGDEETRNYLKSGEILSQGEWIGSSNGKYRLMMNPAGQLEVMYNKAACNETDGPDTDASNLYRLENASYPTNMGKIGYINQLGKLQEYPDNMTGYTEDTYSLTGNFSFTNLNSSSLNNNQPIADISNIESCKNACSAYGDSGEDVTNPNWRKPENSGLCAGIIFDTSNKRCYLRNNKLYGEKRILDPMFTSYLRVKDISNNETCPSNIVPDLGYGSTIDWDTKFKNKGPDMTPSTQCGLASDIRNEKQELDASYNVVYADISNNAVSRIQSLKNTYNKIVDSLTGTKTSINSKLNELAGTRNELSDWTGEQLEQLIAMNEDRNTNMISANYKHILWSILAIIIVILTIGLTKQMTSTS